MLTVNSTVYVVSNECNVEGRTDTITESNILNNKDVGYFYINSSNGVTNKKSLYFSLNVGDLGIIPENAVINNVGVKFYTSTENNMGVYDALLFKLNNTTLATIEATNVAPNTISETSYSAEKMFSGDIYKENLIGYKFECQLITEGEKNFKLLGLTVTVTYTEMMATSTSRIVISSGIIDLPLYTPLDMPRYALRVVTDGGIKAYDLVSPNSPQASPLRIMTSSGIKAVRMSLEKPNINIFSSIDHPHSSGYYFNSNNGDLISYTDSIYMRDYLEISSGSYYIQCPSNNFKDTEMVFIFYDPNKNVIDELILDDTSKPITFKNNYKYLRFSIKAMSNITSKAIFDVYNSVMIYKS